MSYGHEAIVSKKVPVRLPQWRGKEGIRSGALSGHEQARLADVTRPNAHSAAASRLGRIGSYCASDIREIPAAYGGASGGICLTERAPSPAGKVTAKKRCRLDKRSGCHGPDLTQRVLLRG